MHIYHGAKSTSLLLEPVVVQGRSLLPHRKINRIQIRLTNLLSHRSRNQPIQPILMPQQHQILVLLIWNFSVGDGSLTGFLSSHS